MKTQPPYPVMLAGVAALYFCAVKLGLSLAFGNVWVSPVWPPTGIALVALLLWGYRVWPGIAVGAFLAYATIPVHAANRTALMGAALGMADGATIEALAGAWLTQRFARGRAALEHPQSIFRLVALAGILGSTISPSIGVTSLWLAGLVKWQNLASLWFTWWLGAVVSVIVVTPLFLVWSVKRWPAFPGKRISELTALLALLVLISQILFFGGGLARTIQSAPLAFLLIPVLLWAAFRFGQRGTATVLFILSVLSVLGTVHGWGPFLVQDRTRSLLLLQEFLGVVAVIALVLAADVAQREQTDGRLRASEQRYRELFETNPQPMWVFDYETLGLLAVNRAAIGHYGYSQEEFLGLRLTDIGFAEDAPALLSALANAGRGQDFPHQWRHRKKDGAVIDVEISHQNLVFDGRCAGMILSTDVTERKRTDRRAAVFSDLGRRLSAARTSREAAQIILDTADALFGWDACFLDLLSPDHVMVETILCIDTVAGRRTEFPLCYDKLGPALSLVLAQGAHLCAQDVPTQSSPPLERFGDTARPSASRMYVPMRKDQKTMGIISIQSYTPHAYTQADLRALQALADHCSGAMERVRAEAALKESNEQLHNALAMAKMGAWAIELGNAPRVFGSAELRAILGINGDKFDGTEKAMFEFIHPEDRDRVRQALAEIVQPNTERELEFRFLPRQGPPGWMLGRGRAYDDGLGKPIRLTGVCLDITARKEAEQQILRLNQELERRVGERTAQLQAINRELEAFSYSVSHDLRAPLRSIRGFSEVLLARYADQLDARGQEFLRRACESCQQMDTLIDDLLKLSRVSRSEMQHQPVDLSALAGSIAADLRKTEPERTVEFHIAPDLRAEGDERLLRVVLDNLLRNAWKFTFKQPKARIEFGWTTEPAPAFFVQDNGAGFDMAYASKLFGVFQRLHSATEFPGTGVGLATVQRIVTRHGGRAWATGAINHGATFYFTLS